MSHPEQHPERPRSYRTAAEFDDFDESPAERDLNEALRIVRGDLDVSSFEITRGKHEKVEIKGRLLKPSHTVFSGWMEAFARRDLTPFLTPDPEPTFPDRVRLRLLKSPPPPRSASGIWNLVLFLATCLSTLFVGSLYGQPANINSPLDLLLPQNLWQGWPFAATLLSILGIHELGHFVAARMHRIDVSLPYFIPVPFSFGTLGAFIRLRGPIADRRKLLDVGAAGPLAGLAVAIPLLWLGLRGSELSTWSGLISLEGNSLIYLIMKYLVFGEWLPDMATGRDVSVGPVAFAAWIGLLATGLNLLPVGSLDGGHVAFTLFGHGARRLNRAVLVLLALLGIFGLEPLQREWPILEQVGYLGWLIWLWLIIMVMGPFHTTTLDMVTELDSTRRWIAYLTLAVFILTFVPVPFRTFVFIPQLLY